MKLITSILVAIILPGCATEYHARRYDPATEATITIDVKSYREFPGGISIYYDRKIGNFVLKAGEVDNNDAVRDIVMGLLPLIGAQE